MCEVSVIIATKNRIDKLKRAMESLKNQTFKDFEVVIVNDGGESIENEIKKTFPEVKIKIIEKKESTGAAPSRNLAMDNAEGKYFAFLDDDDYYFPDHLANGVELLLSNDFVYSATYISKVRSYDYNVIKENSFLQAYEFNQDTFLCLCYIPLSSVMIKRTELRFDPDLPPCEDWEFWTRLSINGYKPKLDERVSSVYFRVTNESSFTNNALVAVNNYMFFYNAWKKILVKNKDFIKNDKMIKKIEQFHLKCISILEKGGALPHYYFENFTRFILTNYKMNEVEYLDKLEAVLKGEL